MAMRRRSRRGAIRHPKRVARNPAHASRPVSEGRNALWRKRQIILEPELVERLFWWHGGQFTPTYALASTGMRELVSLSMIDAAKDELEASFSRCAKKSDLSTEDLADLELTIGELESARSYWSESTADRAGMDMAEDEYEYDRADYGIEDESEIRTDSA